MQKITADDIRQALKTTYEPPEWYLGFEVGNSTGTDCKRHADAVAINAYPSRGHETRGFEIKVSKSDLKNELENGIKSDEIARFCDYWFLVTPKGLADSFTLPPTWGVIEFDGEKLRQKKRAEKLDKIQPTTGFMCAMLRSREKTIYSELPEIAKREAERMRAGFGREAERIKGEYEKLTAKLKTIKEKTGISLDAWTPSQSIIDRLNAATAINVITGNLAMIEHNTKSLLKCAEEIKKAAEAMRMKEE